MRCWLLLCMIGCRWGFTPVGDGDAAGDDGQELPSVVVSHIGDGTGRVISEPAGIDCPTTCRAAFPVGTRVTFAALADAGSMFGVFGGVCANGQTCAVVVAAEEQVVAQFLLPRNFVFATSTTQTPGTIGNVTNADAICEARAAAVGVPGTYRAWLSTSTAAARSRFGAARGWLRIDRRPAIDSAASLPGMIQPIGLDDLGTVLPGNMSVLTGTGTNLLAGQTCSDYSTTTGNATSGVAPVVGGSFTQSAQVPCSFAARIYCFGVDHQSPVEPVAVQGRLAFVTASPWLVAGGLPAADAFCQAEADAAALGGTFRALLATVAESAASRFDTTKATWVRVDGVPIASSAADVMTGQVVAQIDRTAGNTILRDPVWTGAFSTLPNAPSPNQSCLDWTTNLVTQTGGTGGSEFSTQRFFSGTGISCNAPNHHLYCFEE